PRRLTNEHVFRPNSTARAEAESGDEYLPWRKHSGRMQGMRHKLSDQIRVAIDSSELSRYAICKAIGLNQGTLSRFMRGGGLSLDTIDRLGELLNLNVTVGPKRKGK